MSVKKGSAHIRAVRLNLGEIKGFLRRGTDYEAHYIPTVPTPILTEPVIK